MSVIDDYLKNTNSVQRAELERIRAIALEMIPSAEETISYGMPTIKYKGKSIIGFDARKNYIGIYPFSGSIISKIRELNNHVQTKGSLHEELDDPLTKDLIQQIIKIRLEQAFS
jgi:uncharacterized protein YdhG (YjbR/CyaY superfamily)